MVAAAQRFVGDRRCPICGGSDRDPRGAGKRCHGYTSSDGKYAHCSREDHAGPLTAESGDTYPHRLHGPCKCGATHGESRGREIEATYDYKDEDGELLSQVVRFAGKEFRQRRPRGNEWDWKLGDVRLVVYGLPELLAADPAETVFVVEGEKDVETLRSRGFMATCNPMGAGKWAKVADCARSALRGRHVVVIPDQDKPGLAHAEQVIASLKGVASSLRLCSLPAKDISDWFAEGHTADELRARVAGLPEGVTAVDRDEPIAAQVAAPAVPPLPRWRRCRDLVDEIIRLADEPWVELRLGGDGEPIVVVRAGGLVLLIGGTGRGKTSLAVTMLVEHAKNVGPAIAGSLELPADEWTARAIGTRCDAGWSNVLRGEVPADRMREAVPERLAILDRDGVSIEDLAQAIEDLRREYPGEPILAAVDYVQLFGADSDDEIRPRIGKVMRQLDRIARERRIVLIALSQGSRASSRALSSGEKIGADTTDSGAESADLERWATATLAIGALGSEAEDGSCAADISIGKSRMGGGDRVIPARYNGRSGLWRVVGDARPAAEVRAERQGERDCARQEAAGLAMVQFAQRAKEPVTRDALRAAAAVNRTIARAAIEALLVSGELVEVERKKPRANSWQLWTRDNAASAGIAIVERDP